jgi:hypothetical protein
MKSQNAAGEIVVEPEFAMQVEVSASVPPGSLPSFQHRGGHRCCTRRPIAPPCPWRAGAFKQKPGQRSLFRARGYRT